MTVKELIELLKKENPDAEIVTQDGPIYFLDAKPGYYDGHTPMLIQDKSHAYYNIIGYKWDPHKEKVVIQSMNLESCLYNCNDSKDIDDFIVEGKADYVASALELKDEVKKDFEAWGKK